MLLKITSVSKIYYFTRRIINQNFKNFLSNFKNFNNKKEEKDRYVQRGDRAPIKGRR